MMEQVAQNSQLKNPIFETIILLNECNSSLIEGNKMQMLIKNLHSNIKKVIHGSLYLSKIQDDEQLIKKYDEIIKMESIEYMYYKISTTWDIALQIADLILKLPKGDKYKVLEDEFEKYCEKDKVISFEWYREINKIRNKIVHGGLNIISFYENKRIKFQAYDNDVDEQIEYNDFYNDGQKSIVFADYYFNYYSILLYNYLCDFFKFVNKKYLIDGKNSENKEAIDNSILEIMRMQFEYIPIKDLEIFTITTEKMNSNKAENSKYDFYYR